ncbi:MAG: hypothetical protein RL367_78 [Pseudomonadota bacterium]
MATLNVRDVDDMGYHHVTEIAKENARSVAAELRDMSAERMCRKKGDVAVARQKAFRERHAIAHAPGEDAISIIRAIRDGE